MVNLSGVARLFERYPDVFEVQELRCQMAMQLGGAWDQVQAECDRLMKLTNALVKRAKKP